MREGQRTTREADGHLASVDSLRGIAALSVAMYHMAANSFLGGTLLERISRHGHLGVEAFFVISGYVIPRNLASRSATRADIPRFLLARWLRLYPPYLAAMTLVVVLQYASSIAPGFQGSAPHFSALQLASNATLSCGLTGAPWIGLVYWSLAIEAVYYPLVALCFPWIASSRQPVRIATSLLWLAAPFTLVPQVLIVRYLGLFGIGIVIFQFRSGLVRNWQALLLVAVGTAATFVAMDLQKALAGIVACAFLFAFGRVRWRFPLFLGSISYSLYLIHVPVAGRVLNILRRFTDSHPARLASYLAALGASLGAAYVFSRLVEAPSHRWSRRIRYGADS